MCALRSSGAPTKVLWHRRAEAGVPQLPTQSLTKHLPAPLQGEFCRRLCCLCTVVLIKIAAAHSGIRILITPLSERCSSKPRSTWASGSLHHSGQHGASWKELTVGRELNHRTDFSRFAANNTGIKSPAAGRRLLSV